MLLQCPEGQVLTGVHSDFEFRWHRYFQFECSKTVGVTLYDCAEERTVRDNMDFYNDEGHHHKWKKEEGTAIVGMRGQWSVLCLCVQVLGWVGTGGLYDIRVRECSRGGEGSVNSND